ncbi:helix-turn-helix transcriptional regulator [Anabaena minutissima FACHB-250]|nr:helix-turn-helix transcriptional regulator [Anabaena minutissima FACHB-250]
MWTIYIKLLAMDGEAKKRLAQILIKVQGDRSVRQFALDLDVALGTMQNWLQGAGLPNANNLERIAAAAGMSIEELFAELRGEKISPTPRKAEDILQLALHLDDEERRRLIKLLVDAIGR